MEHQLQFGDLRWPGAERLLGAPSHTLFNRIFRKLKLPLAFGRSFDHQRDMLSLEQAGNLQLLLTEVLDHGVPGAVVELGCHVGGTTAVLARVLQERDPSRELHAFDAFIKHWSTDADPRQRFEANFRKLGLPLPRIHEGDVRTTVPVVLPERIAFAHVDLGVGGDTALHRELVLHALTHIVPRLSSHGVLVLMDLHLPGITVHGNDSNPGVREACAAYFGELPGPLRTLYGGPCSHGYYSKP